MELLYHLGKKTNSRWMWEQVDVFANELRRLAGLAGFKWDRLEHSKVIIAAATRNTGNGNE